jgi:dolichyl-phosphate beta-glucosyltransferase
MAPDTTIVVPCYNEAHRLSANEFSAFVAADSRVRFVFVNDGSTDETRRVLERLVAIAPDRLAFVEQPRNRGKAAAVRAGMLSAFAGGGRYAGYWDADLSTPLREIPRFIEVLETHQQYEICFGSRVRLLGRMIERRASRHYLGRVFATAASLALRLPVYDTQCGAKLFRVSSDMQALFAEPFLAGWTFDIEVIARLTRDRHRSRRPGPRDVIYELPLDEWRDVAGSNVRPFDFVRALVEIMRIRRRYLKGLHT